MVNKNKDIRQEALKCFNFYDFNKGQRIKIDKLEKMMACLGY